MCESVFDVDFISTEFQMGNGTKIYFIKLNRKNPVIFACNFSSRMYIYSRNQILLGVLIIMILFDQFILNCRSIRIFKCDSRLKSIYRCRMYEMKQSNSSYLRSRVKYSVTSKYSMMSFISKKPIHFTDVSTGHSFVILN